MLVCRMSADWGTCTRRRICDVASYILFFGLFSPAYIICLVMWILIFSQNRSILIFTISFYSTHNLFLCLQVIKMSDITNSSQTPPQVPAGFTLIDGPDNLSVLVPTFLVSATQFSLACSNTKNEMEANDGAHGVSCFLVNKSNTLILISK